MIGRLRATRLRRWRRGRLDNAGLLGLSSDVGADLRYQAYRAFQADRLDEAERLFALAEALFPGSARLGLGACRQLRGDLDAALRDYDAVLVHQPDEPYALANRAECLLLAGRILEGQSDLKRARAALAQRGGPADLLHRVEALHDLATGRSSG